MHCQKYSQLTVGVSCDSDAPNAGKLSPPISSPKSDDAPPPLPPLVPFAFPVASVFAPLLPPLPTAQVEGDLCLDTIAGESGTRESTLPRYLGNKVRQGVQVKRFPRVC